MAGDKRYIRLLPPTVFLTGYYASVKAFFFEIFGKHTISAHGAADNLLFQRIYASVIVISSVIEVILGIPFLEIYSIHFYCYSANGALFCFHIIWLSPTTLFKSCLKEA